MSHSSLAIAEAYYTAMGDKNVTGMAQYLHPDVQLISPLAKVSGKDAAVEAARKLISLFKTVTIRAKFGSENQAMLAIDIDFPAPIGNLPAAVLQTFNDGLITKIELFYDGRPLDRKKEEIFS